MPVLNLAVKHGRTVEDARDRLQEAVRQATARFGPLVQRVDWSPARDAVKLSGSGVGVDIRVDAQDVHVAIDVPPLAALLAAPVISGVKQIVQQTFQKRLT